VKHAINPPPTPALNTDASGEQASAGEPSKPFTHRLRRIGGFTLGLAGVLGVLTVLWPPGMGQTLLAGLQVTRPPWNPWWMFTLGNLSRPVRPLYGGGAPFLLLGAVPFVDRNPNRLWPGHPVAMLLGQLVLVVLTALTILMAFTKQTSHPEMLG